MADPASFEEYVARFRASYRVRGSGETRSLSFPCPFCAEPDWYEVGLTELGGEMQPHYCIACARSAFLAFGPGVDDVGLVQCSGPDAPAWMPGLRDERPGSRRPRSDGRLEMPVSVRRVLRTPPGMRGENP